METVSPPVLVGGSVTLVSILGFVVRLWLGSLERRQVERDSETKSQLAGIIAKLDAHGKDSSEQEARLRVVEQAFKRNDEARRDQERRIRRLESMERTPSGSFRAGVPLGGEDDPND